MKETVIVGMSGGVDSSVAAMLLKEQGYQVIGVTMQVWDSSDACSIEREGGCCGQSAVDDARRVCSVLDIPYYVLNFREVFERNVMDDFVREYLRGRTPNPCVACNHFVKWQSLLTKANEIGADYIATGHYARIETLPNGRVSVRNSVTAAKDQTYMLYALTQEQLRRTLMPIGAYDKSEVRKMAAEAGLSVARKKDSQEICFVPDNDYAGFLDKTAGDRVPPPGPFLWKDGTVIGRHKGITHYTIGQRKRLGISMGHRVCVTEIRPETNTVVIGEDADCFGTKLTCSNINLMAVSPEEFPVGSSRKLTGKIRYSHTTTPCTVTRTDDDTLKAKFDTPVRAIAPGQSAVFYEDDHVFGGGIID